MTTSQYRARTQTLYARSGHYHCLNLDSGYVIDGGLQGGEARFINHSCNPNCHIEKWDVVGEWRVGIVASRDLVAGEELSYDYNFESFGQDKVCHCGEKNCRGFLTARPKKEKKTASKAEKKAKKRKRPKVAVLDELKELVDELSKPLLYGPRSSLLIRRGTLFLIRGSRRAQALLARLQQTVVDMNPGNEPVDTGVPVPCSQPTPAQIEAFKRMLAFQRTGSRTSFRGLSLDVPLQQKAQLALLLEPVHEKILGFRGLLPVSFPHTLPSFLSIHHFFPIYFPPYYLYYPKLLPQTTTTLICTTPNYYYSYSFFFFVCRNRPFHSFKR